VDVQLHTFLTLALDGGEWSVSHPSHFTPGERAPDTHWIGAWIGPRSSLEVVAVKGDGWEEAITASARN